MPSCEEHPLQGNWLALDASASQSQVALLRNGSLIALHESEAHASEALTEGCHQVFLKGALRGPTELQGLAYCSGPGSILGIRLSIMLIRTWNTLYPQCSFKIAHFRSLTLAGWQAQVLGMAPTASPYRIICEWRKDQWNTQSFQSGHPDEPISILSTAEITALDQPVFVIPQRKIWVGSLNQVPQVPYSLKALEDPACARQACEDGSHWPLYNPSDLTYVKWSGDRHRAPAQAATP
jgi:tRNA threonylcarbamoyladenosine biosynthesis protein TsaB